MTMAMAMNGIDSIQLDKSILHGLKLQHLDSLIVRLFIFLHYHPNMIARAGQIPWKKAHQLNCRNYFHSPPKFIKTSEVLFWPRTPNRRLITRKFGRLWCTPAAASCSYYSHLSFFPIGSYEKTTWIIVEMQVTMWRHEDTNVLNKMAKRKAKRSTSDESIQRIK